MTRPEPESLPARPGRRALLAGTLSAMTLALLPIPLRATPETMRRALGDAFGERVPVPGPVQLKLPALAENGNSVALTVTVDETATRDNPVRSLRIFSERNPLPEVTVFHFGPRSGRPSVTTRIRLAGSQKLLAVAELADGTLWSGSAEIVVTLAACIDPLI